MSDYNALYELCENPDSGAENSEWLKTNTQQRIIDCLHSKTPHTVVGMFENSTLIVAGILYEGNNIESEQNEAFTAILRSPEHQDNTYSEQVIEHLNSYSFA